MIRGLFTKIYLYLNNYHHRTYSNWRLLCLFIPLFASRLLTMTINIVDSMMVSGVHSGAMSGVSLTTSISTMFSTLIHAFTVASTIQATQRIGRRDYKGAIMVIKKSYTTSYLVALPVAAVFFFFSPQLIHLLFGAVEDPLIMDAAVLSAKYEAISLLLSPMVNCTVQIFTCQGKTKVTLLMNIIANLTNVAGNYLLINVFSLGVAGAKIATIFSHLVLIFGTLLFACSLKNPLCLRGGSWRDYLPTKDSIKKTFSLGLPTGFENNLSDLAKLLVTSLVALCGAVAVNANTVAHQLTSLYVMGGCAVGSTLSIVSGHCKGAGKHDEVKYYTRFLIVCSMAWQAIFAFFILVFWQPILSGYHVEGETAQLVWELTVPYLLLGIPFWTMSYTPPNAFRACGDVRFPMVLSVSTLWICRVGIAYLIFYAFGLGIWSTWLASYADWMVRSICNFIHFKRGRWLNKELL